MTKQPYHPIWLLQDYASVIEYYIRNDGRATKTDLHDMIESLEKECFRCGYMEIEESEEICSEMIVHLYNVLDEYFTGDVRVCIDAMF